MNKRASLQIFLSVLIALFLREVQTRFGTRKMGYFWAIFDAMSMILIFGGLKAIVADHSMPGVDFSVFLATSFLAFFLWKNIMNFSMESFETNRALYAYKQVKPIDAIFVRFILQLLVSIVATLFFVLIGLYFEFDIAVKDFNMVMLTVIWISLFGLSVGIFNAVMKYFYEFYGKIINLITLPLLFISGLMYTVDSLPPNAREIILLNPLVHFMEMLHGNYFQALNTSYVNYEYMLAWTLIPLFFGLFFYRRAEKKIIAS